jgi:phospholipid/cholesterol/gamma-HCH transport system ATP-binding protein
MAMIEVRDLWKSFGDKEVLRGLTLDVEEGQTVVILGRSGVGKSVLLRQILGLDKPDRGGVFVAGVSISTLSGRRLYAAIRSMGMLFQGSALFDSLSVGENAAFYLRQHGDPKTGRRLPELQIRARVTEALAMVDLEGTEDIMPSALSGGMKKRAALARLIVYRPRVLLYDEPTTGLDPMTAQQINRLILRTQQELQATSIVVTHDLHSAVEVGDLLALHVEGQIAVIAQTEEFLSNPHPIIQDFVRNALLNRSREKPAGG